MLAMRKGQNLCHFNSSYCSSQIPIIKTCIETTETYCCFNSRLARIINEGGRSQTGKGWGDCSGFTTDEFAMLDFSRIDMTEFTNEIMANVKMPDVSTINTDNATIVQQKMNNYYSRGKQ